MESLVFPSENSHFLVVTSSLCHPTSASLRSKIAHGTTPAANCPPSVANRGARHTVAGLAFQASSGQNWLLVPSIAGIWWPKPLLMRSMGHKQRFHSPCYAKAMESLVFPSESSYFLVVTSSLSHPNSAFLRPNIAD